MALKRKITKEAHGKLDDALKAFYVEKDGEFVLDIDGDTSDDDVAALKRARDREKEEAKAAKLKAKELQEQLDELSGNDAKKRGDIETLEKSWKEKNEKITKEFTDKLAAKDSFIKSSLIDANVTKLATKISNNATLMSPHIRNRLDVDFSGDSPVLKVLDKDGKPSALSLDDLEKELVANKDFSAIIIGSKASGSASKTEGKQNGGADKFSNGNNGNSPNLAAVPPGQLAAHLKEMKAQQET